jgi:large subunit ribosomal protein L29
MKAKKYYEMSTDDLTSELAKLKVQLFNFRFQLAAGQLANNAQLSNCKRDIARVKTIIRQRELNISAEPVLKASKKTAK